LLITFIGGAGFFVGPIIGAVVFTLLQTVLGLHTELWALYLGILFVACVMFFPSGFAGLIAMHRRPLALGKLKLLIKPYLKVAIPAITSVLSLAAILEILFHKRHGYGGDHEMHLYGIAFDSGGYQAVAFATIIAAISLFLGSRVLPEIREAWDNANHAEDRA
jgi:branched-chain amino acid transport system permease protein